jgi:hypothetical protein
MAVESATARSGPLWSSSYARNDEEWFFGAPALRGGGPGARTDWEVTERDGLWWVRVARTSMPLDALVWRMAYRSTVSPN